MSKIEWATLGLPKGVTWNPIRARNAQTGKRGWHCEKVSPACEHCYAESLNAKAGDTGGTGLPYKPGHRQNGDTEIYFDEKTLLQPLSWRAPRGVFVCSMTDVFGDWVKDEWLDRIFAVIALCPQHRFALLTKRPKRMRDYIGTRAGDWMIVLPEAFGPGELPITKHHVVARLGETTPEHRALYHVDAPVCWPLPNVWLGVTAEDQQRADERIPDLLATPAAVRFVSIEPMLGPVDLTRVDGGSIDPEAKGIKVDALRGGRLSKTPWHLHWVICGGESGPDARPMNPAWARSLRDQCEAAGVAFFAKQLHIDGKLVKDMDRFPEHLRVREFPEAR